MSALNAIVLLAFIVNVASTFLSQIVLPYSNAELSKKYQVLPKASSIPFVARGIELRAWDKCHIALSVVQASRLSLFEPYLRICVLAAQSLVTPVGWAFSIWGLIFTLETIYAIAQLLPALRDADEVKRAGPWFVAACLFQACWSVAFGYEQIYTAQVLILGILLSLAGANRALQSVAHEKGQPSWLHYLLFSLPLTIHFGWLTAASVVSINLTYVYTAPSAHAALLAIAIGSLVVLLMPALSNPITAASGSDAGYALTVAWALAGVATQLASPMPGAPTADPITSCEPQFL